MSCFTYARFVNESGLSFWDDERDPRKKMADIFQHGLDCNLVLQTEDKNPLPLLSYEVEIHRITNTEIFGYL